MATSAEEYAASLNREIGKLERGSLRFWGVWFGRPYDNLHAIVAVEAQEDLLRISFDQGERLSVWSPNGLELSASTFRLGDAERVRFEWYSYGRPREAENLLFEEYVKGQRGTSNFQPGSYLQPVPGSPAVEMLSLDFPKQTTFSRLAQLWYFFRA